LASITLLVLSALTILRSSATSACDPSIRYSCPSAIRLVARLAELDEENALTRQQIIEHEAREIRIRARLCQLRRLADETWAMAEGIVGHEALIDQSTDLCPTTGCDGRTDRPSGRAVTKSISSFGKSA
jgi:hypothetical protein